MTNMHCSGPEMSESLERYVSLYSHQQQLLRRLSPSSSASLTNSSSPISTLPSSLFSPYPNTNDSPLSERSSFEMSISDSNDTLRDVSQQIKCELTALLNQSRASHDEALRIWVQERLLDAEHELKRLRRRHGSVSPRRIGRC